jgi:hypothetical protein
MPLPPLAQVSDVEARLNRELSDAELVRIASLLADASAAVRARAGQVFTVVEDDEVTLTRTGGRLILPQRPVTEVASVEDPSGNTVLHNWTTGDDWVDVAANVPDSFAWVPWRGGIQRYTVTYTHGYVEIPDDIVGVVCQIAARALGRPADQAGITQENIDGYGYSIGSAAASGGFGMLDAEREVCDRYRRARPSISMHAS